MGYTDGYTANMSVQTSQWMCTCCFHAKSFGPAKDWHIGSSMGTSQLNQGLLSLLKLGLVSLKISKSMKLSACMIAITCTDNIMYLKGLRTGVFRALSIVTIKVQ